MATSSPTKIKAQITTIQDDGGSVVVYPQTISDQITDFDEKVTSVVSGLTIPSENVSGLDTMITEQVEHFADTNGEVFAAVRKSSTQFSADKTKIYRNGQMLYETDTNYMKLGDGKNTYDNLPYVCAPPNIVFDDGTTIYGDIPAITAPPFILFEANE